MKSNIVTIAEGKKTFSRLIRNAAERNEAIVVTKRGKPMAVIISHMEYLNSKKMEAYKKIFEARRVFLKAGVSAEKIYKESKKELEKKR